MELNKEDWISVNDICERMELDKSNFSKSVFRHVEDKLIHGVRSFKTRKSKMQPLRHFHKDDVEIMLAYRESGFVSEEDEIDSSLTLKIYLIQTEPIDLPLRVKIGVTTSIENRLRDFRTTCSNPTVVIARDCDAFYEEVMLKKFEHKYERVGEELFNCNGIDECKEFFNSIIDFLEN